MLMDIKVETIEPFENLKTTLEDKLKLLIMQQSVKALEMIKDHIEAHTYDIDTQHRRFLKHVNKDEKKLDEKTKPETTYLQRIDPKDPVKLSKPNEVFETNSKLDKSEEMIMKRAKLYLKSYMDVVKEDFVSNIARYIRYFLIQMVEKNVKAELIAAVCNIETETLLSIDNEKLSQRNALLRKLNSLEECHEIVKRIESSLDKTKFYRKKGDDSIDDK